MLVWLLAVVAASGVLAQDQYSWPWFFSPASGQCGVSDTERIYGGYGAQGGEQDECDRLLPRVGSRTDWDLDLGSANWELRLGAKAVHRRRASTLGAVKGLGRLWWRESSRAVLTISTGPAHRQLNDSLVVLR
jgi:hypothetical protein